MRPVASKAPSMSKLRILEDALHAGAALVDLEIESADKVSCAVPRLRELGSVCLSYHNFEKTPVLDPIFRRLRKHTRRRL